MRLYKRGDTWWADVWIDGKRTRRSLKTSGSREAKALAAKLSGTVERRKPAGRTLYEALTAWVLAKPRGRGDLSVVKRVREQYADRPIEEVTNESFAKVFGGLAGGTYDRYISTVAAALKLSHQDHGSPPPTLKKRRPPEKRLRFLSPAEWQRLREHLPPHLVGPVEFSLATGLRRANVFGLRWDQVNLEHRTVTVWADQAKGRKTLILPLSDWAVDVLKAQAGRHETFVFVYGVKKLRPMSSSETAWHAALAAAGIEDFRWHDLRHTWASWAVQAGTPLPVLQQLGGWESMEMVQRYAHLGPSHLAQWANVVARPTEKVAQKVAQARARR